MSQPRTEGVCSAPAGDSGLGTARDRNKIGNALCICRWTLTAPWQRVAILSAMRQVSEANSPSPSSSSFVGLLASLAAPAAPEADRATDRTDNWPGGDLGEDVVTLSYERALRSHARYKSANLTVWEAENDIVPTDGSVAGASAGPTDGENVGRRVDAGTRLEERARTAGQAVARRESRSASVTIRLSNQECAQLRQRAVEAGLTVSAYLRSCVLEADSLRAQVKEALAGLRSAGEGEKPTARNPAPRSWFSWMTHALPRRRNLQTSRQS